MRTINITFRDVLDQVHTVGARKIDTLRNKLKQKLLFLSFIVFLAVIYIILKEHIYKEKIFLKK